MQFSPFMLYSLYKKHLYSFQFNIDGTLLCATRLGYRLYFYSAAVEKKINDREKLIRYEFWLYRINIAIIATSYI